MGRMFLPNSSVGVLLVTGLVLLFLFLRKKKARAAAAMVDGMVPADDFPKQE